MNRKNTWEPDFPIDFQLVGVVSPMKEYRLGWHLNQLEIFHLVKIDDIKIEFTEKKIIRISSLAYETEFTSVHLLRNKLIGSGSSRIQYLLPELRQFDYFIKLKNSIEENWSVDIVTKLKSCEAIDYTTKIDIQKIQAKENLIF